MDIERGEERDRDSWRVFICMVTYGNLLYINCIGVFFKCKRFNKKGLFDDL